MAIPVPVSAVPLAFDALPALKVRHYYGGPHFPRIYTLARLYIHGGALALSLSAFEREPEEGSRVEFALGGGEAVLRLSLTPAGAQLTLDEEALPAPGISTIAGADEQGWYWGGNLTLPADLVARTGCRLAPGAGFAAALFKAHDGRDTLGSAFPLANPRQRWDPGGFGPFEATPF